MKRLKPHSSALLILGMHRSGTSAITRILNLLGVDIGSHLIPANSANEKGFWELVAVARGNEEILQSLNSAWFNPFPLPEQWWQSPLLSWWRHSFSQMIQQNFAESSLWGIKDPRLCRLLPLWFPLVEELGSTIHCVIIIRPPEEVAASLQARDQLSRYLSLRLWLTYTLEAEYHTRSHPRVFITYHELLQNWQKTVEQIASTFKFTWPNPISSVQETVDEFLTTKLKHHDNPPLEDDKLAQWSQQVYQTMVQYTQNDEPSSAFLDKIRQNLQQNYFPLNLNLIEQNQDAIYQEWLKKHSSISFYFPKGIDLKIHILIHLLPEQQHLVRNTIKSLLCQTNSNLILSIIAPSTMEEIEFEQSSIRWIQVTNDLATTIHREIESISADWVSFIQAGDCFHSKFLETTVCYIQNYPQWQFIYTDEDSLSISGKRYAPQFKPDFNLDLLRSTPYIGHFCLTRRVVLQKMVGSNWINYEVALKIRDHWGEEAIGHIPHILCHHFDQTKPFVDYKEILKAHLQRNHLQAEIYETDFTEVYCIDYLLQRYPLISIIIAIHREIEPLQHCLRSLLSLTNYPHYEVLIVSSPIQQEVFESFKELKSLQKVRLLEFPTEANLATLYNFSTQQARGEYLLFLNDETEIIQADWLQNLLLHNQRSEIGIVGARLLDAQHRLLQGGLILGMGTTGIAGYVHQGLYHNEWGYLGRNQAVQNFSAVSDACLMIKRSLYIAIGGMEETLNLFNDVDLCLKAKQHGYKIVWTPYATLLQLGIGSIHRSQQSLSDEKINEEIHWMYQHWLSELSNDPDYHPSLCLNGHPWQPETQVDVTWDVRLSSPPRIVAFPYDSWGCGEYRVRAPLRALQQTGKIISALMPEDHSGKMPTLTELVRMKPDSVFLHNTLHDFQLDTLALYHRFTSCFKIFSQDDLLYALPPTHPNYTTQYQDVKERLHRAIRYCDRLIVTTEPLADAYRTVIDDICIIPNYLERERWIHLSSQRCTHSKPRIGWAGAAQHQGDLQLIIPVVKALAKQVEWVFFGLCLDELRPYLHEFHPMVPFKEYPAKLASLNLDLAIAPLQNNAFNEAKSNLRLLEYGILGWSVICSDIYPYRNAPVTRVNNTPQAWLRTIREHLDDLEATAQQGQQLKQWVTSHWILEDHLTDWLRGLLPCTGEVETQYFASLQLATTHLRGDL